jgi:putative transposase
MQIRYSAHGAYHHQYHIVWIPKYRKRVIKGDVKKFIEEHLFEIQNYHPDIEIEKYSLREDHVHLIMIIPPRYSVSGIVGKIKTNTSREIRKKFQWVRKIYYRDEFWSRGFFSSTVGVNEEVIRRYVEFQEKIDKGQMQLSFDFEVPRA